MAQLSSWFGLMNVSKCSPTTPQQHATAVWALPFSLATTWGIIIIFFSSGYLDVSVLRVGSQLLEWYTFSITGCPIRKSSDITLVCSSPKLIAAYHVLHRLSDPRHSPYTLNCFKNLWYFLSGSHHCINATSITTYFIPNMSKILDPIGSLQCAKGKRI